MRQLNVTRGSRAFRRSLSHFSYSPAAQRRTKDSQSNYRRHGTPPAAAQPTSGCLHKQELGEVGGALRLPIGST